MSKWLSKQSSWGRSRS